MDLSLLALVRLISARTVRALVRCNSITTIVQRGEHLDYHFCTLC